VADEVKVVKRGERRGCEEAIAFTQDTHKHKHKHADAHSWKNNHALGTRARHSTSLWHAILRQGAS
jgi:hypothetical protein